ncbi:MAG: type II toxin-antitoxin system VapC family toxin [Planctomycetes bacterium]|nr:type II toxin-antitoxin system VapC family toxin [Planctomycetota bacterium]
MKDSRGSEHATLTAKMAASPDQDFVTAVITLEEQMRGWLALTRRHNDVRRQLSAYAKLNELVDYFSRWPRLSFDKQAADEFDNLRRQKIRVAIMDLKIAATVLVHGAVLLSANLRDFQQVPNLHVEDWLH